MNTWWKKKRKEVMKEAKTMDHDSKFTLGDYVKINADKNDPDNGKVALIKSVIFPNYSDHVRYDVKILDNDVEWEYDESELKRADSYDIFISSFGYYKENKEENKMKKFTKDDLKVGMLVVTRGGSNYIIMDIANGDKYMVGKGNWHDLHQYSDDLLLIPGEKCMSDIMQVYSKPKDIYSLENLMDLKTKTHGFFSETPNRDLLWTRGEVKEMTVEEISKALGYEVKIVK